MVDSWATEGGCVDPMLLPENREKRIDCTTLDPPKRLLEIGNVIVKADTKGKMPVILTNANDRNSTY